MFKRIKCNSTEFSICRAICPKSYFGNILAKQMFYKEKYSCLENVQIKPAFECMKHYTDVMKRSCKKDEVNCRMS